MDRSSKLVQPEEGDHSSYLLRPALVAGSERLMQGPATATSPGSGTGDGTVHSVMRSCPTRPSLPRTDASDSIADFAWSHR